MRISICCRVAVRLVVSAALGAGSLAVTGPARAVVNGTLVPDADRRLDAVGLLHTVTPWQACGGWISGTCTLIGPRTVLLARHSVVNSQGHLPPSGAQTHSVRFRRGLDGRGNGHFAGDPAIDCGTGQYQEIFIREFIASPGIPLDMVLGELEHAPAGITPIEPDAGFAPGADTRITLAGWGYDGACIQTGDAWTLRYDTGGLPPGGWVPGCCFEFNRVEFEGNCMIWPPPQDWVAANMHDSGAPILVESAGPGSSFRLIGMTVSIGVAYSAAAWNEAGGVPPLGPIDRECVADFDGSGEVTALDMQLFLEAWFAGGPEADLDGSGQATLSDLFEFIARFVSGC